MRRVITLVIVIAHLWSASTANSKEASASKTDVLLDQIFAVDMPGTKSIRELEPDLLPNRLRVLTSHEQKSKLNSGLSPRISEVLSSEDRLLPGNNVPVGFAVAGSPEVALQGAFDVLVDGKPRKETFSTGSEINLIFFSYLADSYIHVKKVSAENSSISIQFEVVPHSEKYMTSNFAIIPLGELPPNKYYVEVIQSSLARRVGDGVKAENADQVKRLVSGSFSFAVED